MPDFPCITILYAPLILTIPDIESKTEPATVPGHPVGGERTLWPLYLKGQWNSVCGFIYVDVNKCNSPYLY
jgi:hypothetical protein